MPDRFVLHPYSTGCYHNNLISLTYFQPSWDDDTDDFLKAMLTGSDLSTEISGIGSEAVCPSDTSSDSGCPEDRVRTLTSPGLDDGPRYSPCLDYSPLPNSPHSTHSVDLVEYLSNGKFKKIITNPSIPYANWSPILLSPRKGSSPRYLQIVQTNLACNHSHHHHTISIQKYFTSCPR